MVTSRLSFWIVILLLVAGAGVRAIYVDDSRFMAERQYRSALIARAGYLVSQPEVEDWRRNIAAVSAERLGVLEPPIMEAAARLLYRALGEEELRAPRLLAAAFWIGAGLCVYFLARAITSPHAAVYATAYYIFLPLGVAVSTSFLPDALMHLLYVAGVWLIFRHEREPTQRRLLIAGVVCGACVLVKPICAFALAGAFAALRIQRCGWRGLFDPGALLFASLFVLPAASYYAYGILVAGFLAGQASVSFVPELLVRPMFWAHTGVQIVWAVGAVAIVLALLGFALPDDREFRALVIGLCLGHLALCLVFTYHVRMAAHYHLALAVPVALCAGVLVAEIVDRVRNAPAPIWIRRVILLAAGVALAVFGSRAVFETIHNARPVVDPSVARAVGQAVGHSDRVVYVSQYYGMPLEYHGELSGWYWPRPGTYIDRALHGQRARARSVEERLANLGTVLSRAPPDFSPEFFVITDMTEFANHDDLAAYLEAHCALLEKDSGYLVYGRCR